MVVLLVQPRPDFQSSTVPEPVKKPQGREYAQEVRAPSNRVPRSFESPRVSYMRRIWYTAIEEDLWPPPLYGRRIPGVDHPQPRSPFKVLFVDNFGAYKQHEYFYAAFRQHVRSCSICARSFWNVREPYVQSWDRPTLKRIPRTLRDSEETYTSGEDAEILKSVIAGTKPWINSFPGCALTAKLRRQKQNHHAAKSRTLVHAHAGNEEHEQQEDYPWHDIIPGGIGKDNIQAWKSGSGRRKEWRKGAQKRIATRRQQSRADNDEGRQKSRKIASEQRTTTMQPHAMLAKRQRWPRDTPPNPELHPNTSSRKRVRLSCKRRDHRPSRYADDGLRCDVFDDDLDSYTRPESGDDTKSAYEVELNTSTQLTLTLFPELPCPPEAVKWNWASVGPLTLDTTGGMDCDKQSSPRRVADTQLSSAQSRKERLVDPLDFSKPLQAKKEAARYSTVLVSNPECREPAACRDNSPAQKDTAKKTRRTRNRGIRKLAIPYFRSIQHLGDFLADKTNHLKQLEPASKAMRLEQSSSQDMKGKQHNFIRAIDKKWNQLTALQWTYELAQQDIRKVNSVLEELMLEESAYEEIVDEMNLDLEESLWSMRKNPVVTPRRGRRIEGLPLMHCWTQNGIEYDSELWDWLMMQDAWVQATINSEGGARQQGSAGADRSYGAIFQNFPGGLKLLFDY